MLRVVRALLAALLAAGALAPRAAGAAIVVEAPAALASAAARVRGIDAARLADDLARAGLALPPDIRITLVPEDDPRTRAVPRWIVGLASGERDIVIFPGRVLSYPYDSLESVVRHEIAHLALSRRAGGGRLPRWFHEGVAVSVDAGWDLASRLQLLLAMRRHPGTDDLARLFGTGAQADSALAYRLAAALVEDVRRRHGAAAPGAIAARVAAGVPFERAFTLETGETPDQAAARAWAGYRRWTAWVSALTSGAMPWMVILALAFVAFFVRTRRRARRRRLWEEEEEGEDGSGT